MQRKEEREKEIERERERQREPLFQRNGEKRARERERYVLSNAGSFSGSIPTGSTKSRYYKLPASPARGLRNPKTKVWIWDFERVQKSKIQSLDFGFWKGPNIHKIENPLIGPWILQPSKSKMQ